MEKITMIRVKSSVLEWIRLRIFDARYTYMARDRKIKSVIRSQTDNAGGCSLFIIDNSFCKCSLVVGGSNLVCPKIKKKP